MRLYRVAIWAQLAHFDGDCLSRQFKALPGFGSGLDAPNMCQDGT